MKKVTIAIDTMGGDYAPKEIVLGALGGARDFGVNILLVGAPAAIESELSNQDTEGVDYSIVPSKDVVRMDEDPIKAIRSKPDASINVACRQVLEGKAAGVISMGHSGASIIAASVNFGRIPGVERPAPVIPFLGLREDLYLTDAGANTDVLPRHLLQFARMGTAYLSYALGIQNPRVGLLSNGSEPNKGNQVGKEAYSLLETDGDINFIGNIEGHSMFTGGVDLVISDGFTGNVLIKSAEGIVQTLLAQFKDILASLPPEGLNAIFPQVQALYDRNDYSRVGAAALLGVQRPMFFGHGRSKAIAVRNGIGNALNMITTDIVGKIRLSFSS
jgi:glycerol-3-phosphate acyltransferase PlsX